MEGVVWSMMEGARVRWRGVVEAWLWSARRVVCYTNMNRLTGQAKNEAVARRAAVKLEKAVT